MAANGICLQLLYFDTGLSSDCYTYRWMHLAHANLQGSTHTKLKLATAHYPSTQTKRTMRDESTPKVPEWRVEWACCRLARAA